jgi:hypothetical protein
LAHVTFFREFRQSNQTSEVSKCSDVLFIFYDFSSCRVISKTEENTENYFLIKEICKEQKSGAHYGLMQGSLHLEFVEKNFVLTNHFLNYLKF